MADVNWAEAHPGDVFSVLETVVCSERHTFKWHDVKPRFVKPSDLKESGVIEMMEEAMFDKSDEYVERMSEGLKAIANSDWTCRVGIVQGPPGSGKTRLLSDFADSSMKSVVAVPTVLLLRGAHAERSAAFTIYDLATRHHNYAAYKCLIVDEYTLVDMCEVLALAFVLGVKNVVLFGDPIQGLDYEEGSERYFNFPVLASSDVTYRMPSKIVDCYNRVHGTKLISKAEAEGELDTEGDFNDPIPDEAVALVLSCTAKDKVLPIKAEIASSVQGLEFPVVCLFLCDCDKEVLGRAANTVVAFSRATQKLIIRCEDPELLGRLFARLPFGDHRDSDSAKLGKSGSLVTKFRSWFA